MAEHSSRKSNISARRIAQMRKLPRLKFVQRMLKELGGRRLASRKHMRGFQGHIVVSPAMHRESENPPMEECRWYAIKVCQKDKVGRPNIDSFEAMMMREDCDKGFFVGFDFSSDALTEIDKFFKRTKKIIVALTVREILDEEIAKKLA